MIPQDLEYDLKNLPTELLLNRYIGIPEGMNGPKDGGAYRRRYDKDFAPQTVLEKDNYRLAEFAGIKWEAGTAEPNFYSSRKIVDKQFNTYEDAAKESHHQNIINEWGNLLIKEDRLWRPYPAIKWNPQENWNDLMQCLTSFAERENIQFLWNAILKLSSITGHTAVEANDEFMIKHIHSDLVSYIDMEEKAGRLELTLK